MRVDDIMSVKETASHLIDGFGTPELPPFWQMRFDTARVQWALYSRTGAFGLLWPGQSDVFVATLGPALQFSRELTVAAPTITLWAISGMLFLEAARSGKAWAWAASCAFFFT